MVKLIFPIRSTLVCLCASASMIVVSSHGVAHEGHDHEDHVHSRSAHDSSRDLATFAVGNPAGTFDNQVEIQLQGGYRVIRSNGLPSHATGEFPGRKNPNRIREQRHSFRVPANPKPADQVKQLKLGKFGVALNGVPFDPGAAEFWNRDFLSPWQYAVIGGKVDLGLDMNNAHVQPTGDYHYHGRPVDLIARLAKEARRQKRSMTLVGYAADGYPIYDCDVLDASGQVRTFSSSYELKTGQRPSGRSGPGGRYDGTFIADWQYVAGSGDLDEFNGRTGPTPEYPDGTFYYVLTKDFPYIPRQFKGTPDPSFSLGGPGGRGGPPGRRGRPPGFGPPGVGGRGGPPPPPRRAF